MLTRTHACRWKALFVAFALVILPLKAAKPNFLVIVTDDQRPDTINSLGNPRIHTPNLDRLVENGTTFTNFLCSNPLCVPSRAEILTGCTGFHNGVLGMGRERMDQKLKLWPQRMSEAKIYFSEFYFCYFFEYFWHLLG